MKVHPATPSLPNFVTICREDGGVVATSVPIAELSDEDIRDLGRRWTEALIEHARRKRDDAQRGEQRVADDFVRRSSSAK